MNKDLLKKLIFKLLEEKNDVFSEAMEIDNLHKEKDNLSGLMDLIGKYVIVRSRNEGLNAGYLEYADKNLCVLQQAKRLWKPISKDANLSWYEGVAMSGLDSEKSICSGAVDKKIIVEDYSITLTTSVAEDSIKNFISNKTTY